MLIVWYTWPEIINVYQQRFADYDQMQSAAALGKAVLGQLWPVEVSRETNKPFCGPTSRGAAKCDCRNIRDFNLAIYFFPKLETINHHVKQHERHFKDCSNMKSDYWYETTLCHFPETTENVL